MSLVHVLLKVLPDGPESDLDELLDSIEERCSDHPFSLKDHREEDIAYGLKALYVLFSIPDEEGTMQGLEDTVNETEGVSSLEVVSVSR